MEPVIQITVDGQSMHINTNTPLLTALKEQNIDIPALCYHPATGKQGRCSLCIIEISIDGIWKAKHACMLNGEADMQIRTISPHIHRLRSWAAHLLLERGPFNEPAVDILLRKISTAAEISGVDIEYQKMLKSQAADSVTLETGHNAPVARTTPPGCILCGRCISICHKIDKHKLTFLGRGKKLRISYINRQSDTEGCGKCHACERVCPTAFIHSNGQTTFTAKL